MSAFLLNPSELALLQANPWFRACAAALQQQLCVAGRRVHLAAGQTLFARGAQPEGLCFVLAGALRVGSLGRDGSERPLTYLEPGQWFGEISLLDDLPRTHDAVADGPASVWLLPQRELQDWLNTHPACWRDLARLACAKLRASFEVLEDIAHLPLEQRLAKRLALVARGFDSAAMQLPKSRLRLPQEQLALMLGVSRQTVNKALKSLAERGLLALHYAEIELLDLAGLDALAAEGRP